MVARLFGELLSEDLVSRRARPGMDPGRADVIIGGTTILVGAMRKLGFSECLVSEADILDGLVFSILGG
jgi:exopolyphosphatase/guanosine-5'-triphosphate,3'-diphosphate pyrophosphatase